MVTSYRLWVQLWFGSHVPSDDTAETEAKESQRAAEFQAGRDEKMSERTLTRLGREGHAEAGAHFLVLNRNVPGVRRREIRARSARVEHGNEAAKAKFAHMYSCTSASELIRFLRTGNANVSRAGQVRAARRSVKCGQSGQQGVILTWARQRWRRRRSPSSGSESAAARPPGSWLELRSGEHGNE